MVVTNDVWLPTEADLTVPEINLSSGPLVAAAHHLGKFCDHQSKEFMLCWYETQDPRACIGEGKEVTRCGMDFFKKTKKHCAVEFTEYFNCVDRFSGSQKQLRNCRKTQTIFDTCVEKNLGQTRPEFGHFSRVRLHKTNRPKHLMNLAPMPERMEPLPDFKSMDPPERLKDRLDMPDIIKRL